MVIKRDGQKIAAKYTVYMAKFELIKLNKMQTVQKAGFVRGFWLAKVGELFCNS